MVRENRIKYYEFFGSPTLYGNATTGTVDVYSENPINGRIQSVYFKGGNWDPAGSLVISISGTAGGLTSTEGIILNMTSGPSTGPGAGSSTGHHIQEDWVVFPRATSVSTDCIPLSSGAVGGYNNYQEIPIWSVLRVQAGSVVGPGSNASGLIVVYI